MTTISIRRPDDWHVHLRDGDLMKAALPYTTRQFGRAIVMPNLKPPVADVDQAIRYRERIIDAIPPGDRFTPLMTAYLCDNTDPMTIRDGFVDKVFTAAKWYPAGATTHSEFGVTDARKIYRVLEAMQKIGMPLLLHGEVTDQTVDVFDRESVFVDKVLSPLVRDFPELKIVLEHITTAEAAEFVAASGPRVAATITPQHLMFNRSAMFAGGIRPHYYCLPVLKRERHRAALRRAATSGNAKFFLGTDSAPHARHAKEASCGCAGIFNAPLAMEAYATVFDEENALDRLELFASINGPVFYGLPVNEEKVTLRRRVQEVPKDIFIPKVGSIQPFLAGETLSWEFIA